MLHKLSRLFALLAMVATLAPGVVQAAPIGQPRPDALTSAPCMFMVPADRVEGQDVICGYLTVPERHDNPAGKTIQLAVVIIKSKASNPAPDPLVMMQGGPGGSTIDIYGQLLFFPGAPSFDRDIVLFDQRGTLHSRPSLICQEQFDLTDATIERRLSKDEGEQLSLEATQKCHERLVSQGIDLGAYNSFENAADVEALRVALGYDKINLYGVSYGTLLAQHVARNFAQGLRSVILDAVVPAQSNGIIQVGGTIDRALSELFTACAADAGCNAAYPNLEQVLFDTVDKLNQEPAYIALTDPETGKTYPRAVVDGDSFFGIVFQLLYASEILPALPRIIYDANKGDLSFLAETVLPQIVFDRTLSIGMYYSVNCAEEADYTPRDVLTQGLRPKVAENAVDTAENLLKTCSLWQVPPLGPAADAPVTNDIPTLIFSGRFDPVTPPPFGEEVARSLSRSYIFVFGANGLGAFLKSTCANDIVLAFLDNPQTKPDGSCLAADPAPRFVSPATLLNTDAVLRILRARQPENLWQPALLAISLLVLLTSLLVYPLIWLVNRIRRRQGTAGAGPARWVAALSALVGVIFLVGFGVTVFQLLLANDLTVFFGLPRSMVPLVALPLASLLLTVGMIWFMLRAWVRGQGSVVGRLYYTLLTLAAVGYVAVLGVWGLLRVLV